MTPAALAPPRIRLRRRNPGAARRRIAAVAALDRNGAVRG